MHNLFAPLVAERVTTARGRARARRRRRRLRRPVRHRRRRPASRSGTGASTARSTKPGGTNDTLCPGGQTAVPTMAQTSPGQVHDLRRVVGRPAAAGEPGRRPGRRAAGEVHPRRRQAVRAQPAQRRHLHGDGAGLRRPDQRVLLVRPRDAPRQRVHSRRRRPVGPPRRGDRSPRARVFLGTGDAHVRSADPPARQRHRRREARREQAAAARRLLRRAERQLAVAARSRRQHDAGGVRLSQAASSSSARARSAGCGCSIATRSAARITARRCTRRRSSATTRRRSTRKGVWGALERVAGREGHAVGAGAVLGTGEHDVQGADRARAAEGRRRRGVQAAKSAPASGS